MEIEVRSQSENEIVFVIRDAEVPFVNAIRRIAMMKVPNKNQYFRARSMCVFISGKNTYALFLHILFVRC